MNNGGAVSFETAPPQFREILQRVKIWFALVYRDIWLGEFLLHIRGFKNFRQRMMIAKLIVIIGTVFALAIAFQPAYAAGNSQAGEKLYQQYCAKCHGSGGKGDGPELKRLHAATTPNDWTDKETNAEMPDKAIVAMVTKGGQANGKSKLMPSFQGKLDDAQISDLIAYIRTLPR